MKNPSPSWIRALSPRCCDVARLQSHALDNPLPIRLQIGLRMHLLLCKWCRRYGRQLQLLRNVIKGSPAELMNETKFCLSGEDREFLKKTLRNKAASQ